ncbi:hypothetical protein KEH51_03360 [[Brevibacterium] frigoritolerans]|uniref:Uncharacterized protein n=1 Tax=Peribacillus frigoritolerans TaxID=450367 RepID=A0A941FGY6_9BACI|nr:hypothetical protein [Peribacillus frigoritolerans]
MERWVRDSCGKSVSKGDPAGAKSAEDGPRGKRVPGVEINVQIVQTLNEVPAALEIRSL